MKEIAVKKLVLSLAVALAVPGPARAASELFAEQAKVIANGDEIQLFGMPSIDAEGNVKYFDTTIRLRHGDSGKPRRQAMVTAQRSSEAPSSKLAPGTYADDNVRCKLRTETFGDETEGLLDCTDAADRKATVVVYTGPAAENPSAPVLIGDGVNAVPGTEQYAWGLTTASPTDFGGCLRARYITSVRQINDVLVVIRWVGDTPINQYCSLSLRRVVP